MKTGARRPQVVIIHPGALGDVLLALPAIRMIRRRLACHHLVLLARNQLGRFLQRCGEIDEAWSTEAPILSALYAATRVLPPAIRDALSGTTHVAGWISDGDNRVARHCRNLGIRRVRLMSPMNADLRSRHMSDRYVETLGSWGAPFAGGRTAFSPLAMAGMGSVDAVRRARAVRTVFIHPGSGSPHKCLPCDSLGRLVRDVGRDPSIRVALCEGPADRDAMTRLLKTLGETRHETIRGQTLEGMSRRLMHADVFFGHDSGLTHLAAAWGVPTVAVFGPTDPDQWRPLGDHVAVRRGPACRCRTWTHVRHCRDRACVTHSVDTLRGSIMQRLA